MNRLYRANGFNLLDMLLALGIIAVLLFFGLPNMVKVQGDAEVSAAKNKARELNVAKSSYLTQGGGSAEANWKTVAAADVDGSARYALVKSFLGFAPTNLKDYVPAGFTIDLGTSLYQPVTLYAGTSVITY